MVSKPTSQRRLPDGPIIITIDGPAGTGKSSVARQLAARLGLDFLDTGAMYRAAAAITIDHGIDPADTDAVVAKLVDADLHFDWQRDPPAMLAWLEDINGRIRDADVTGLVSDISALAPVREHLVRKQRIIARQHPRLVSEGRDQGSIVFPDAAMKFYLDARADVRAKRRADQLRDEGKPADEAELRRQIELRDRIDSTRAVGPLTCPEDAVVIDTSDMSFDEVVDTLHARVIARVGV